MRCSSNKLGVTLLAAFLFLFLGPSCPIGAAEEEFQLPLLMPPALTSTFCEYRNGHFHSGIDLSTESRTGVPVVAVGSGYVYRVRASGVGYGKAVYLLLDNGMFAVYGHLESFSEKIQSFVLSKQIERERYEVDVFPLPFQIAVEKGEILGHSGNSGSSSGPHLHFELRRGAKAVNPLAGFYPLEEHIAPTFLFVKLTPLGIRSHINDRDSSLRVDLSSVSDRRTYGTSVVPRVAGRLLVSVSVFDRTESEPNRLCIYEVKLFLDDSLLFESRFDEVEFSRTHEVDLAYDRELAKRGENFTLNLCRFEGSKMSLLARLKPGAGIIDTDLLQLTGLHTLRIEASDIAGNTSTASVQFIVDRRPRVSLVSATREGASLLVTAQAEDPDGQLKNVWLDYRLGTFGGELARVAMSGEVSKGPREETGSYSIELSLPGELKAASEEELVGIFKVVAEDSLGAVSCPFTQALTGTSELRDVSAELTVELKGEHVKILVWVSPPFLRPRIGVARGDTLWLDVEEKSEALFAAVYELEPGASDAEYAICTLEEGRTRLVSITRPLGVFSARKGWEGTSWNKDARAGFRYGPETFYKDTYISIRKMDREAPPSKGLTFASDIFSVEPGDVVFDKKGTVIIRCDSAVAVSDRIALYWRPPDGTKWRYAGALVDTLERTVSADVRGLWEFSLLKDEAPPSVFIVHPSRGRVYRTTQPPIYATVKDVGSGITWQGTKVTIDGKKALSIWDPKISRLSVEHHEPILPGKHVVTFEVTDRSGNTTRASSRFRISG